MITPEQSAALLAAHDARLAAETEANAAALADDAAQEDLRQATVQAQHTAAHRQEAAQAVNVARAHEQSAAEPFRALPPGVAHTLTPGPVRTVVVQSDGTAVVGSLPHVPTGGPTT